MMSLVLLPGNLARSSASAPPNLIVQMGRLRLPRSVEPRRRRRSAPRRSRRTLPMTCMENVRLVVATPALRPASSSARLDAAHDRLGPVDDRGGLDDVALHPQLLGLETQREPEELRQVQGRHVELAAGGALGQRVLQVEVQVAQRARRHEAVGVGVDRVAEVAPRLLERHLLVHRDDREPAALVLARVLDDRAAERLDDEVEIRVARMRAVDAQAVGRADDVAAVERADAEVLERPLHARAQLVEPHVLDEQPEQVLVREAGLVLEPVVAQVGVDVLAVVGVRVEALLALGLRALARRAEFIISAALSTCWASANVRAFSVSASSWLCSAMTPA